MNCPPDIADAILEILTAGLLRARTAGWEGDAERSAVEADHVHNLPDLLREYSDDRLSYYWDVERPSYIDRSDEAQLAGWEPYWGKLFSLMKPSTAPTRA